MSYIDSFREEERNKEKIYSSFESEVSGLLQRGEDAKDYYDSGSYEDQDSFFAAASMWGARKKRHAKEQQVKTLYDKPYFAHIRMRLEGDGDCVDCFLTDNENLDGALTVLSEPDMHIVPFKQDKERPFLTTVFHCYQAKTDEKISVTVPDKRLGQVHEQLYHPELIRDVDVYQRQIRNVITFLPQETGEGQIEADELLSKKLDENRNNTKLRNIIATLQLQQFDIIRTDIGTSFIVQGCAGSGKTQCLIHRLFFLRDFLQDSGWNKVLLITPTQLFRNYSSELIRRYHLETVANISLAVFYKKLLESFDQRFSNRQYRFELTEEYLPDAYLQQVYVTNQIEKIDAEIDKAIQNYVTDGCRLTGEDMPQASVIDINFVNLLSSKLAELINQFDETEKLLSEDAEYQEHRREQDSLEKQLKSHQKKLDAYIATGNKLREEKALFDNLLSAYEAAHTDIDAETRKDEKYVAELLIKLRRCIQKIESCHDAKDFSSLMSVYASLRDYLLDKLEIRSDAAKFEAKYKELLSSIYLECKTAIFTFTKDRYPKRWLDMHVKSMEANEDHIKKTTEDIELVNLFIEDHNTWLREHNLEDAQNQRKVYRAELERSRYFLSRIESSVFEREVWNALAPLKTECGIETIYSEQLSNGRQKQSKILYKSDLLFYLKIYNKLYKTRTIPEYNLICIDEGQDLDSADYDLIKSLYPKAVLNVFGDTEQVLHEACGINDWRAETGIEKLFEMNSNYRNNASIADFCNKNFGSKMTYYGKISSDQAPKKLSSASQIDKSVLSDETVVIVKNEQMFKELCTIVQEDIRDRLLYVDTRAERVPENVIPCYSIFAAKGLEFRTALVYAKEMTKNQKVVACTRAMEELFYNG